MKFTEEHEWLLREGDVVTVGITGHAAGELGDLVFVELPEPGLAVAKGDHVVTIESVKAASDILAPLAGKITEVNTAIADNPALVSEDAQGKGWFFRMTVEDWSAYEALMDEGAYLALIG